jgi:hypothetical protein
LLLLFCLFIWFPCRHFLSSRLIAIYIHLIRSVCSRSTFYFIFLQVIQQVNFG